MRKLAVLRMNDSEPCPFGLNIPVACHTAGETTLHMAPLEILGNEATNEEIVQTIQANTKLLDKSDNRPCYFANEIIKKNAVDCTFGQPNVGDQGGGALRPSTYYNKPMSGTGTDGLYSYPRGYYSETALDRPIYYGPYSIEGIANNLELNHMLTTAQLDLDGVSIVVKKPDANNLMEVSLDDLQPLPEAVLEVSEAPEQALSFKLPNVPGGDFQDEIQPDVEVDEPKDVEVDDDPWKWQVKTFLPWLQNKMQNIPKHTGKDSAGIERAISYLKYLNKEISRAVQMDLNNDIAIEAVEAAREEIYKGIERLEQRLAQVEGVKFKRKKKGEVEQQLTKEAQRTSISGQGVQVVVPLLISSLARSCINGTVSAGHDMNVSYKKMVKEYNLTKREQLELQQLISDMGFPVRRDFGVPIDEPTNTRSTDNVNWPANYPG